MFLGESASIIKLYNTACVHSPVLEEYLNSRSLSMTDDIGYVKIYQFGNSLISDSIVMFCRDILGDISTILIRSRTSKRFRSLWTREDSLPMWNIHRILAEDCVIITESIFDSEAINQNFTGVVSISLMGRKSSKSHYYYLQALTRKSKVFVAFDNDIMGRKSVDEFCSFMLKEFQRDDINILDFPFKDLNEFLKRTNRKTFTEYLYHQIF